MLNLPTNSFWMFSGTWYTCGTVTAGSGHQDLKSDVTWFDDWYPETQVLMDEQPLQTLAQMSTQVTLRCFRQFQTLLSLRGSAITDLQIVAANDLHVHNGLRLAVLASVCTACESIDRHSSIVHCQKNDVLT